MGLPNSLLAGFRAGFAAIACPPARRPGRLAMLMAAALLASAPARAGVEVEVEVEGLNDPEKQNVESLLSLREAAAREDVELDELRLRSLHQQADAEIRRALQPYGYYQPRIRSELHGAGEQWVAHYRIEAGPRTQLVAVNIEVLGEARDFPAVRAVLEQPLLKQGEPLLHELYEQEKVRLQQAAYNGGYLDASYARSELRVTPSQSAAEVFLTLNSGERYYFGEIRLDTQGLDEVFLRNYLKIESGQPFDPQRVLDTQFVLGDLDYFQSVEMVPLREEMNADREIPIDIRTTPRPRRRYEIGAGYGSDTGARFTTAVEARRLGDTGHKLRGEMRLSETKNTYGGEYRIPLGNKPGESLSFTGTRADEKFIDGGESLKYTLGTSLARRPGDWQRRLYLEYAYEESRIGSVIDTSNLLIPGVSFNRVEADNPIHTRAGWSLFADVHGANRALLASASFLQARGLLRVALPLGERLRALGRVELGATLVDDISELPASQRFFAGGDQSVRGYSYQSLGPRDADGRVVGGQFLSTFSGELDYRFGGSWQNWGVAAFLDAGGADDDPGPELSTGIGAGLRYWAPIGYINLDLAHPLDDDDRAVRLHLSVRVGL
jgi:translocation and assembly module TamA